MNMYDQAARFYDRMFPFSLRLESQKQIFLKFLENYPLNRVTEAGCGTGVQSLALAECGLEVIGTDISEEMLSRALSNSKLSKATVQWIKAGIEELPEKLLQHSQDAVFILGNTLCHLTQSDSLYRILTDLKNCLVPRGYLILQLLNYTPILKAQQRVLNISRETNEEFIRFYDFLENGRIRFNILHIAGQGQQPDHELISQELYPYTRMEIEQMLTEAGYHIQAVWEELDGKEFDQEYSGTLCIVAQIN